MSLTIRRAEAGDLDSVKRIWHEAYSSPVAPHPYSHHTDGKLPKTSDPGEMAWIAWSRGLVDKFPSDCFVADLGGKVIGFEFFEFNEFLTKIVGHKWAELGIMAVEPGKGGLGAGTSLVKTVMGHVLEDGAEIVGVGTDLDNLNAISCYEKEGMRTIYSNCIFRARGRVLGEPKTPPNITIRPWRNSDLDDIQRIYMASGEKNLIEVDKKISAEAKGRFREEQVKGLLEEVSKGAGTCSVAQSGGEVVGFAIGHADADFSRGFGTPFAEIDCFAVDPPKRGVGIGTALVGQLLESLMAERGATIVDCWVSLNDWPSINCLEKNGFGLAHATVLLRRWLY